MRAHGRTYLLGALAIVSALVACSLNPQPEPPLTPGLNTSGAAGSNGGKGGGAMAGGASGMAGAHAQGGQGQGGDDGFGGGAGNGAWADASADATLPSGDAGCPCEDPGLCEAGADADWDALCPCEAGGDAEPGDAIAEE